MTKQRESGEQQTAKPFAVGDKVWCEVYGAGVVKNADIPCSGEYWRVEVQFSSCVACFSLDGWFSPRRHPNRRIKHIEEPKKEETTMREFKVGDKVTCEKLGEGVVLMLDPNADKYYQVYVRFSERGPLLPFGIDGWFAEDKLENERIKHIDVPASPSSHDYIQELINAQGIKPITDPGFEEAAQKLAQKLAYALLNEDKTERGCGWWINVRRRPNQSVVLWRRAYTILCNRGLVISALNDDVVGITAPPKKGAK
jgi:hypothetical protein